jgi:organic hydroperoxide reductase OsmC/OhrA
VETSVNAKNSIGQISGRFGLAAELAVNIPDVTLEVAQDLTEQAHQVSLLQRYTW